MISSSKTSNKIRFFFIFLLLFSTNFLFSTEVSWAPDFLVIGAAKSGTSQLIHCLYQHPMIVGTKGGVEVHYFTLNYSMGVEWYQSKFEKRRFPNQLIGEKSPSYLSFPIAAQRAHDHFPNLKIIMILRNPIDRSYSFYQMRKRSRQEPLDTFEKALNSELERTHLQTYGLPVNQSREEMDPYRCFGYVSRSIYIYQVDAWLQFFPFTQILVIDSKDLQNNPDQTLNQVYAFLGLPEFHGHVMQPNLVNTYEPMDPETRKRLSIFFEPYNQALEQLWGVNFSLKAHSLISKNSSMIWPPSML
jgi:hypothetical protein